MLTGIRYSLRQISKAPCVSTASVLMLALGIGATAGMYSVFHTVLKKPLPVDEPDRLVNLTVPGPKFGMTSSGQSGRNDSVFSYPMLRDLESGQDVLTGIAGHRLFDANLAFEGQAVAGEGYVVSGDYFRVLGVEPALGTLIGPQHDAVLGESPVAVLSFDFWQTAYGGDRNVIGRTLTVNGETLTVIGVAGEAFTGTTIGVRPAVFAPLTMYTELIPGFGMDADNRQAYWVYVFARLRDEVTAATAEAALNGLYQGITSEIERPLHADLPPDMQAEFIGQRIVLESGAQGQSNVDIYAARPLTFLLGVTGLLLAVVCVNIGGLLLVRGDARLGEAAIRVSIGASRGRLIRLFLTEAALLSVAGAMISVPVAVLTIDAFASFIPVQEAGSIAFRLERPAFYLAAILAVLTLLVSALYPAIVASRADPATITSAQGEKSTGSRATWRFRSTLAGGQVALSVVLLVLCGLFARSLFNVASLDLGMNVDEVVTFSVNPGLAGYDDVRAITLLDRIEAELRSDPGVLTAATSTVPLLTGSNWRRNIAMDGVESGPGIDTESRINWVSPDFFRTLSMTLVAGRAFTASDDRDSSSVAMVNEAFLRKFNLDADVIGRRLSLDPVNGTPDIEIVGLVSDASYSEVKEPAPPQVFFPRSQSQARSANYYVRSAIGADAVMRQIRSLVAALDPNLPVTNLASVSRVVDENIFLDRIVTMLTAGFASMATLLAAIGLYATFAFSVARRTRELGIRLALGATPGNLRSQVLRRVGLLTLFGAAAGLVLALLVAFRAQSLLFGLTAMDPLVLSLSVLIIGLIAASAGAIPACRAANVAPIAALRHQ